MSCHMGRFCSEKAALSGDRRKFEKPSRLKASAGSFGVAELIAAYFVNRPCNSSSVSLV